MAIPQTISELKKWYQDTGFPPESKTRFFIGVDYPKRRAFGIYQDGDQFIVYKNKGSGERVIRYQGNDEAYAVKELYLRLLDEVDRQRTRGREVVPELDTDEARGLSSQTASDGKSYYDEQHKKAYDHPESPNFGRPQSHKNNPVGAIICIILLVIVLLLSCDNRSNSNSSPRNEYDSSYDSDSYDSGDYDSGGWDSGGTDFSSDW